MIHQFGFATGSPSLTKLFDSKIIDGEDEGYGASGVSEESWCVLGRMVVVGGKVFDEALVG
jgi:hypothetical protein